MFVSSCDTFEEVKPVFDGQAQIEVDATVLNAKATGRDYPLLTRVPGYGRPVITTASTVTDVTPAITIPADPLITRTSGTIKLRVNLVTAQRPSAEEVIYKVVDSEVIGGTSTVVTTAVAGTHYTTSGKFTIPANSSFGEIEIQVLNPGTSSATPRVLVLELSGNANLQPAGNYKKVAISIAQN